MSYLSCNCLGLRYPRAVRPFKKLIKVKEPSLVFPSDTGKKDFEMNCFRNFHGFSNLVAVSCQGDGRERAGGLACFWRDCLDVQILSMSLNHIDMLVKMGVDDDSWRCTGIYGYPKQHHKTSTCDLINSLARAVFKDKWLLFGDFNLVLSQEEKSGGNAVPRGHISMFRNTLQCHGLCDLGFDGDMFTWHNNQDGDNNIQDRLDRFVAFVDWMRAYPKSSVVHLLRHTSDHMPIFLRILSRKPKRREILKVERFEQCWLHDESFKAEVCNAWNRHDTHISAKISACIPKNIRKTQADMLALSKRIHEDGVVDKIRELERKLDDLIEREEV